MRREGFSTGPPLYSRPEPSLVVHPSVLVAVFVEPADGDAGPLLVSAEGRESVRGGWHLVQARQCAREVGVGSGGVCHHFAGYVPSEQNV